MINKNYDFAGWATYYNIKCLDGRTISKGAFKEQNGIKVPLVDSIMLENPENVFGHLILEDTDKGVYAYGYLTNPDTEKDIKELLKNGTIKYFGIYADKLVFDENDKNLITKGFIREVSLCQNSANPKALITEICF